MALIEGTIPEALAAAAARDRGELVFHLADGPVHVGVVELAERAAVAARTLVERGIEPGDRVGIIGPNRPEWAVAAYAAWSAGAVVVPVQIPLRVRDRDAFCARVGALVRSGGCKLVLGDPALLFAVPGGLAASWEEAAARGPAAPLTAPDPGAPAVIQFTSGSTAAPKGAVLSHAAVLAQARALAARGRPDPADEVMFGWAPFFHDLGLFLYLVTPVLATATGHVLPTELFARVPAEWLRLVAETGTSMTVGPQSAWSAAFQAAERRGTTLDLGGLEMAWFAAEGIDPAFVDRMLERGGAAGLSPAALGATYGLAEAVMGVTTTPRDGGIRFHAIDRAVLGTEGRAAPATGPAARRIVSCGSPMLDMEVRIADGASVRPDGHVGEIQVRGPSLMTGYLGEPGAGPFVDGWLRTGDLGYRHEGELYVTGRAKDVLIVMGQNHYPEDFEWAAARVAGVREGRSVAFVDDAGDRLVLLVEPRRDADPEGLARAVRGAVTDVIGAVPYDVLVVAPGTIEKTTSGKVRRAAMRAAHAGGVLELAG